MSADKFAPPPEPEGPPLALSPPARVEGTLASDEHQRRARRGPKRYRRPLNTPLVIWVLAVIGGAVVFLGITRGLKNVASMRFAADDVREALRSPVNWQPVAQGDAVLIQMQLVPRNARVLIDGVPADSNPVRLQKSAKVHKFVVMASGHLTQTVSVSAAKATTLNIKLVKE